MVLSAASLCGTLHVCLSYCKHLWAEDCSPLLSRQTLSRFCRCSCGGTESVLVDLNSTMGSSFQDVCMLIKFQFFSRSLRTLSSPLTTNHQRTTHLGLSLAILYFLLTKTVSEGTLLGLCTICRHNFWHNRDT